MTPPPRSYANVDLHRERHIWQVTRQMSIIAASAAAGVLATDLVSAVDGPLPVARVVATLVAILVATVTALLANRKLDFLRKSSGTVYFIRYQFPGMANWHTQELRTLAERLGYQDLRAITREVSNRPDRGVIDLVDDVKDISQALEIAVNTDDAQTGIRMAVDMQWMAAMAVGHRMYGRWETQQLDEMRTDDTPQGIQEPSLGWHLIASPGDLGQFAPITLITPPPEPDRADADVVLVTANLTPNIKLGKLNGAIIAASPPYCRPEPWRDAPWYGVGVFASNTVEGGDGALPNTTGITFDTPCMGVTMADAPLQGEPTSHPWLATVACVKALRAALHAHPAAIVVFTAQVPKTVGLALGWHLVRDELPVELLTPLYNNRKGEPVYRCAQPCCANPWRRLVPLYFDLETQTNIAARVHPSQPTAEDLRVSLGLTGGV